MKFATFVGLAAIFGSVTPIQLDQGDIPVKDTEWWTRQRDYIFGRREEYYDQFPIPETFYEALNHCSVSEEDFDWCNDVFPQMYGDFIGAPEEILNGEIAGLRPQTTSTRAPGNEATIEMG